MTNALDVEFQVKRRELEAHRTVQVERRPLVAGEIRLAIDRFAFTANNLTYGAAGDLLGYWHFFPAANDGSDEWGILPVWGFADVIESTVEDVPVGDRLYGYFPPASTVVMTPTDVRRSSLTDGSLHRQKLPPLYNGYRRVLARDDYDRAHDDATVLLAPLHLTSFVLAHQLSSNGFYDADQVLIVSASSKTSLGLAFALSGNESAPSIAGATSTRNADFVSGVGLYDATVTYDTLESLPNVSTVVVDMAGNPAVSAQLASHLGTQLHRYINVGLTHWEELGAGHHRCAFCDQRCDAYDIYVPSRLRSWLGAFGRNNGNGLERPRAHSTVRSIERQAQRQVGSAHDDGVRRHPGRLWPASRNAARPWFDRWDDRLWLRSYGASGSDGIVDR